MGNKNFYLITKGQLITMWIFGFLGTILALATAEEESDSFYGFLAIGIVFFF